MSDNNRNVVPQEEARRQQVLEFLKLNLVYLGDLSVKVQDMRLQQDNANPRYKQGYK
jgi:hypothetical protein